MLKLDFKEGKMKNGLSPIGTFGFIIVLALYFTGAIYWILLPMIDCFCRLLGIPQIRW